MAADPDEETPLLQQNEQPTEDNSAVKKILQMVLDMSPFIAVTSLAGSIPFAHAAAIGCGLAVMILASSAVGAARGKVHIFPKTLDLAQALLFAVLWLAASFHPRFMQIWDQPIINFGFAVVMLGSLAIGRPFVVEYVQEDMPQGIWNMLSKRRWFFMMLEQIVWSWIYCLTLCTAVTTIPAIAITIGAPLPAWASFVCNAVQVAFVLVTIYIGGARQREQRHNQDVINRVMANGADRALYPLQAATYAGVRITSLTSEADIDTAASTLGEAFAKDCKMEEWCTDRKLYPKIFKPTLSALSHLGLVLGSNGAQAVLAAIPNYTDEVKTFTSEEARRAHGFDKVFLDVGLPPDHMFELMSLKSKYVTGPYMYIQYFGACDAVRGQGIAKPLLMHVLALADAKTMHTVLETGSASNRVNYEKYGFNVVASVNGRPDYVLMVREAKPNACP